MSWNGFWTKLRDERGKFESRLAAERAAFVESLQSLDPRDHGQSLKDFEAMQSNKMRAFEENQSAGMADYLGRREARFREFGAAQEVERQRLAEVLRDSWTARRAALEAETRQPEGGTPPRRARRRPKADDAAEQARGSASRAPQPRSGAMPALPTPGRSAGTDNR